MRRVLSAFVLVFLIAPFAGDVDAQRIGLLRRKRPVVALPPTVSILVPDAQPTFATNAASVSVLSGLTTHAATLGIKSVTWSNAATGGSGTATLGDGTFAITASAGSATIGQDTFDPTGSNVCIDTRGATPYGDWTEVEDTGNADCLQAWNGTGAVRISASDGNDRSVYILTPDTALSGTDLELSVKVVGVAATTGVAQGMTFATESGASPNDFCAVVIYEASANPDLYVISSVAGTKADVASVNADIGINDTVLLDQDGNTILVKKNGSTVITTSAAACNTANRGVGLFCGNVRTAGDDCNSNFSMDDFLVVDRGATQSGIALNVGDNVITITVTDTTDVTATDIITVTLGASDTQSPTVTIQAPTSAPTHGQATATVVLSGISDDNVGVSTVGVSCTNATPGTPMVTGTTSWSAASITLTDGVPSVCTVTATDAATNTGTDQITITYTAGDMTNPTVTITSPTSGATHSTATSPFSVGGTCTDNAPTGCTVITAVCAECPSSGSVSGTANWTAANVPFPFGDSVLSVTGCDAAGNCASDTLTVTITTTALNISTTSMPPATVGTAYSFTLSRTGGTAPFTWGNNGAGTTLNDGDAQCAGLTVSTAGVVSGTPSANGTCTWTASLSDGAAGSDTQAINLTVNASGAAGPHDYFNTMIARGDCRRAYSFRPNPVAGTANVACENPHARNQLTPSVTGSIVNGSFTSSFANGVVYNFAGDTDANKQDAAAVTISNFLTSTATLSGAMASGTASPITFTMVGDTSVALSNDYVFRVDSEIFRVQSRSGTTVTAHRAQFGTSQAEHSAGAVMQRNNNNLYPQLRPTLGGTTTDGNTIVIGWDVYYTASYFTFDSPVASHKAFQISHVVGNDTFFLEPRTMFRVGSSSVANTCNESTDIFALGMHSYNQDGGPSDWTLSNGLQLGPGWRTDNDIEPTTDFGAPAGTPTPVLFCAKANTWTRMIVRVKQVANDYDLMSMWACDENQNCSQLYTEIPVSIPPPGNSLEKWWLELNTSWDRWARIEASSGVPFGVDVPWRMYVRNWFVLYASTAGGTLDDLTAAGVLVKPVR